MSALRKLIEDAPAGTMFTREGLLAKLEQIDGVDIPRRAGWIDGKGALAILSFIADERALRRRAAGWERSQVRGDRPAVRVSKKTAKAGSDWLYWEDDCLALARDKKAIRPQLVEAEPVEDEADAIAEALYRRNYC